MKLISKFIKNIFFTIVILLITFISSMYLYPEKTAQILGFRFYTVLTDSMEPTIPTYSLVLSKLVSEHDEIIPNSIITFKADRFGENILITHYFRGEQEKDGITYYRTQAEGRDANDVSTYDSYETMRSDIVGTYLFHVPYIGKIILFLQSKFGFLMYALLFIIYLLNKLLKARWDEKEAGKDQCDDVKDIEQKDIPPLEQEVIPPVEQEVIQPVELLELMKVVQQEEPKQRITTTDSSNDITTKAIIPQFIEDEIRKQEIYLCDITFQQKNSHCMVEAFIHNDSSQIISSIQIRMTLYDADDVMAKHALINVAKDIKIQPGTIHRFVYDCNVAYEIAECRMYIVRDENTK